MSSWAIYTIGAMYVAASALEGYRGDWRWAGVWACYGCSQFLRGSMR